MSLNGKQIQKPSKLVRLADSFLIVFVFFLPLERALSVEDVGQRLRGDEANSPYEKPRDEKDKSHSYLLGGSSELSDEDYPKIERKESTLDDLNSSLKPSGIRTNLSRGDQVLSFSNSQLLDSQYKKTNRNVDFSFAVSEDMTVDDSRGIFKKTYVDDPKSKHIGPFVFSSTKIWRKFFEYYAGVNAGVGYLRGRGAFATDQSYSETYFSLWKIPIDLNFGFGVPLSKYFKLGFNAGPSVMFLWQTRNDMTAEEKGKYRRQVGTGYYYSGRLKINIGRMFTGVGYNVYTDYGAPGFYVTTEYKYSTYDNFQDNFSMTNQTLSVGFSFEYL